MSTPTNEELSDRNLLVRQAAAALKIKNPEAKTARFRTSLFAAAAAELPRMNQLQITRLWEAICEVDFPKEEVLELRTKIEYQIGKVRNLKQYRQPAPSA